ncbi:hypothetical protein [Aurantimonas sp. VKM B-3413]|uniref:hypothetical protein n=1 Tax=Aurantimonas sp. VKM B-3413 TaxID=2779401 RepID=UPI001E57AD94|nr:hypothetical protein [Aurantimonas sp. VKM B-3413]MCB8836531.1 hypothetical protein [Aurantimonas sp. VKM B-3413]
MSRGLDTFDAFSWASLLAGKDVLVCDVDERRAFRMSDALEEAGARATIAGSQRTAIDRLARRSFAISVVALPEGMDLERNLAVGLESSGTRLVILAAPGMEEATAAAHPAATVLRLTLSPRQLVMSITGTADE